MIKIRVTLRPQKVVVERNGQTHSARWRQRDGNDGELYDVTGDESICKAALTAWCGEREFEITDEELALRGGGWWSPQDPV